MTLRKLALRRDPTVPIGQPAPLHLECPCGARVDVGGPIPITLPDGPVVDCVCGARYTADGWVVTPSPVRS